MIKRALSSHVFGGSVLLPVGSLDSEKREKKNPLFDEIESLNIDIINDGGLYQL